MRHLFNSRVRVNNSLAMIEAFGQALPMVNGTIKPTVAGGALTISLKTAAGNDPSPIDPVILFFHSITLTNTLYVPLRVIAPTSLVISSGSTMGFSSGSFHRLWVVGFNDNGVFRLGAINVRNVTDILSLRGDTFMSSSAEGGAGAADSSQVVYTGVAVTTRPMRILAFIDFTLATAGVWDESGDKIQLFGLGVSLPGTPTGNFARTDEHAVVTGTTTIPDDDTMPQNTEGILFDSQAITPTATPNILVINSQMLMSHSSAGYADMIGALFQDSIANALAAVIVTSAGVAQPIISSINHRMLAATTSLTTFKLRGGTDVVGTTTFNGWTSARKMGGVMNSFLEITEIMG